MAIVSAVVASVIFAINLHACVGHTSDVLQEVRVASRTSPAGAHAYSPASVVRISVTGFVVASPMKFLPDAMFRRACVAVGSGSLPDVFFLTAATTGNFSGYQVISAYDFGVAAAAAALPEENRRGRTCGVDKTVVEFQHC